MLFIYLLEANPAFAKRVETLHKRILRRGDRLCASVFTIGEALTGPRKRNDTAGIKGIKGFFDSEEVEVLPFNRDAADRYSMIRAGSRISQADAINLAAASAAGVDVFVTNDKALHPLSITGIRFMMDLDGKVY
jgi:predicted nucleic acid-binding protein